MIRKVSDGAIHIGDESYSDAVALSQESVLGAWDKPDLAQLTAADFADLIAAEPELIVLGTGTESTFAPRELVFALARKGIGLEVMTTPAAARTFNVLAGEGRRIVAVLYP